MPFGIGIPEVLIILIVVLLVFGPRRLPEMAKGIGQSVREFRKGIRDIKEDINKEDEPKRVTVVESPTAPTVTPAVTSAAPEQQSAVTVETPAEAPKEPVKSA